MSFVFVLLSVRKVVASSACVKDHVDSFSIIITVLYVEIFMRVQHTGMDVRNKNCSWSQKDILIALFSNLSYCSTPLLYNTLRRIAIPVQLIAVSLRKITFSRAQTDHQDMSKESSYQQTSLLNALTRAHENPQLTSMGSPVCMAREPRQSMSIARFSKTLLSEILREALEIIESVDIHDEIVILSARAQGTPPTKQ